MKDVPILRPDELRRGSSANDGHVSRALDAMTRDPKRRWTVAELARVAGLSRSAFARRFSKALGVPPLRWLAEHRLALAEQRLLDTSLPLAAIAFEVGYECEFAFAKAFKRHFGKAPGIFRRHATSVFRAAA